MRIGVIIAIAIPVLGSMYVVAAHADQCPPGSGKFCPAGTYCCGSTCCKEDYAPPPPPPPPPPPSR